MNELEEKIASVYPVGDSGTPAFVVTYDPTIPVIGIPIEAQLHRIKTDVSYTLTYTVTNESGELVGNATEVVIIDRDSVKDDPAQLFNDNTVMVSVRTMIAPVRIRTDESENLKVTVVMFSNEMATAPSHTYLTTRPQS